MKAIKDMVNVLGIKNEYILKTWKYNQIYNLQW